MLEKVRESVGADGGLISPNSSLWSLESGTINVVPSRIESKLRREASELVSSL